MYWHFIFYKFEFHPIKNYILLFMQSEHFAIQQRDNISSQSDTVIKSSEVKKEKKKNRT